MGGINPEEIEVETKEELRQLLIDDAWRQYMYNKAAQKLENKVAIEKNERRKLSESKKEAEDRWESNTENRVNNWRNWTRSKNKKKGLKLKKITKENIFYNDPLLAHEEHLKKIR